MEKLYTVSKNKTIALYFYPVIYCVSVMISGVLADRWGRKKTIVLFGTVCFITFALFVLSARSLWNPRLVGLMYGLYLGGYWIGRDYMEIVSTEMVPTDIRASIVGAEGLLVYIRGLLMVALRSQGNWRWEGPLGTPLGLVHWKRASSPVEAGTAGYL